MISKPVTWKLVALDFISRIVLQQLITAIYLSNTQMMEGPNGTLDADGGGSNGTLDADGAGSNGTLDADGGGNKGTLDAEGGETI